MLKTVLVGALALAIGAGCSGPGDGGGMMPCAGCKMEPSKDRTCPKDGMCMKCDKGCAGMARCKSCSMEVGKDKMCARCGSCAKCDRCSK
jgi:hypothetical protein